MLGFFLGLLQYVPEDIIKISEYVLILQDDIKFGFSGFDARGLYESWLKTQSASKLRKKKFLGSDLANVEDYRQASLPRLISLMQSNRLDVASPSYCCGRYKRDRPHVVGQGQVPCIAGRLVPTVDIEANMFTAEAFQVFRAQAISLYPISKCGGIPEYFPAEFRHRRGRSARIGIVDDMVVLHLPPTTHYQSGGCPATVEDTRKYYERLKLRPVSMKDEVSMGMLHCASS